MGKRDKWAWAVARILQKSGRPPCDGRGRMGGGALFCKIQVWRRGAERNSGGDEGGVGMDGGSGFYRIADVSQGTGVGVWGGCNIL